ncbi:MAG: chemotaxis-specific protein-glutamate methyltransferase CheB [Chthoniobacteraceae bacterium]
MSDDKIRVFIVDDSRVACEMLTHVLGSDPGLEIIGSAGSGAEAIAHLAERKADVVTMDIHMPGLDGFAVTRQLMETAPVPIVIVTASYHPEDVTQIFRALEAGALALVEKPPGLGSPDFPAAAGRLIQTVKAMSEVRVIRRWARRSRDAVDSTAAAADFKTASPEIRLVAIGASTGGPPVVQTVLAGLPKPVPVPVLIVQHISVGFASGFADWLGTTTGMPVCLARHGMVAEPGTAYLAPDGFQMTVSREGRIRCADDPPENGSQPAVSCLFRSVAENFGSRGVGVLLTGMGRDGADGLKLMRDRGGVTFAQDKESSIVHGMPGEAIRLGAALHVGSPSQIAARLRTLLTPRTP